MKKINTLELVTSSLLLATGVVLPMMFHVFGMTGPIALPMHIPVLIGGFLLCPQLALALGAATPIVSGLLTGMPVMFPMAVIMAFELGTYGFTAALITRKFKIHDVLTLIVSMISGRVMAGLTVASLVQLFGVKMNPLLYVKGAVLTGIPGIIIQIIFIPAIVFAVRKYIRTSSIKI